MKQKIENTSDVKTELKRKLSVLAESSFEEENEEAGFFLNQFLNKEPFDKAMAEYLYASDICSWMNGAVLDSCMSLLTSDADTGWYMLIQSISDEEESPEEACKLIIRAYEHGLNLDDVQELFASNHSVSSFECEINEMIAKQDRTLCPEEKICADNESLLKNVEQLEGEKQDMPMISANIFLKEVENLKEYICQQFHSMDKISEFQLQFNKLDDIKILSDKVSTSIMISRQMYEKIYAMEKDALKQQFHKERMEKELKKAELTIRLLTKEKKVMENYRVNSSDTILSDKIAELKEIEKTLQEQLKQSMEEAGSLKDDKEQLALIIKELRDKNNELQVQLVDTVDKCEKLSLQNQQLQDLQNAQKLQSQVKEMPILEEEKAKPINIPDNFQNSEISMSEDPLVIDEMDFIKDMGWNLEDIKDVVSDKIGLKERVLNFARKHSKYYEREYEKRPVSEQENLIFVKMMELHFSKEKVLLIKNILQSRKTLSRVEIYKFLAQNPSEVEITSFFENAA